MKRTIEDLAVFRGTPAFSHKLHVGRPNIGDRATFNKWVNEALDRNWLTNTGPVVTEFERAICNFVGVKHCVATCNATLGLQVAFRALGLAGEVIVPSFTFVATAHALEWVGITPVFCDVDSESHSLDPQVIERCITPQTTAILAVHLWGKPCYVRELSRIARQHSLKLIFDSAHAFGCSSEGTMIGNFGDVEVFSFHATKFLNTFEGGAVVTNDDQLARRIWLAHNFGIHGYDTTHGLGTNAKMNEVCAAMGLTGMESIEEFVDVNRRNYHLYESRLRNVPGIRMMRYDESERCNFQYIVIEIEESLVGLNRDLLMDLLWAENVLARRYFYPGCHRVEPYSSRLPQDYTLPITDKLAKSVLVLPTGTAIQNEDVSQICDIIQLSVSHGDEIAKKIKEQSSPGMNLQRRSTVPAPRRATA
jgi:dTDP-4-amino-4,6-dideoxygalactose transaminase